MKTKLFYIIILCLIYTDTLIAQEFTTKMETIYSSDKESTRIQHIKSALDSKGNLHIVFTGFESHSFYGTNKSGEWKFEKLQYVDTESNETIDITKYPNIAIDQKDNIHMVMFDRYKEKLVYASRKISGSKFELKTVEPSPKPLRFQAYGEYTDLAVDNKNGLHLICCSDFTDQKEFKYNESATYFNKPANSDKWQVQILIHDTKWSDRNWSYGKNSSITCYKDKVYAAIGGDNELHFGTRNISGGTWDIEKLLQTSDKFINSGKDMVSLAVSPDANIKVAFFDHTDDEKSPWHGLTIYSQNNCKNTKWNGYNGFDNPKEKNCPAVTFDTNGKFYIATGRNGYTLWHRSCDCGGEYKKIFSDENKRAAFVDMITDKQNTVYTFYVNDSDNKLRLLTAKPKGSTKVCNYAPRIVKYTGKTNLKPGEKWTATITASDDECDKIKFESIIKNKIFTIKDNGNGTATITATMPTGNGKGTPGLSVWALDEKHPDTNKETSVITFKLVVTPEGKEKGSVKIENKCK